MTNTKSRLILNLTALLIFCLLLSLGVWQLQRAEKKRLLLNDFSTHASMHYLQTKDLDKAGQSLSSLRYFPIKIEGHYDNDHVFLLDNKFYQHQLGYEVLTPFVPKNSSKILLVNRGWIPRGHANYPAPPIIPKVAGKQNIQGILYVPLSKPFVLAQMPILNKPNWPLIVEALQIDRFEMQLKKNLYPAIIWLNKEEKNGFARDWHPVIMLPAQHIAYAIQWFALALTLLIIYIVLSIKSKRNYNDFSPKKN